MKKNNILLVFTLLLSGALNAQDLICKVQVITPQIQNADKQIYQEMEKSIYEFINTTKWTSDVIQINERIECNIIINVKEQNGIDELKLQHKYNLQDQSIIHLIIQQFSIIWMKTGISNTY